MTDKQYRDMKLKIQKYLDKWVKRMGVGWYDMEFIYSRDYHPDESLVNACTLVDWHYRHGSITFYLPSCAIIDNDHNLEKMIVHELCHVIASPLWDLTTEETRKQGELAIESIALAFMWCDKLNK